MKKFHHILHIIAYYTAWFACMKLASHDYVWLSALTVMVCVSVQICWQYKVQQHTCGLWYFIGLIVFISTCVDSLLVFNGFIIYAANPWAPYLTSPWMITIWISFAVIVHSTMQNLFNHKIILGLLSFAGFTVAYAMGVKMGAAVLPYGYISSFLPGAIWVMLLPVTTGYYQKKWM